tara:strand:+ start:2272 stop:2898 length:627 start_codon:yes stop_codon:yes gene_type:complete
MPRKKKAEVTPESDPKIELRKAKRIHSELKTLRQAEITKLDFQFQGEDVETLQEELADQIMDMQKKQEYINTVDKLFTKLDHLIYQANATSGINEIISSDAHFKRIIERLESSLRSKPHKGINDMKNALTKAQIRFEKSGSENRYHSSFPQISCSIFSASEHQETKTKIKVIKGEIRKFKDMLHSLNVHTFIRLDNSDMEFLKKEHMI